MRLFPFLLSILLLLYSVDLEAQTDVSIRRSDFIIDERPGFEEAWKHVKTGDLYYSEKGIWYNSAFDEYLQAIVYNNSNPELNYKTGASAIFSDNKEEAAGFLLKALELKYDVADDILLLAGRALQFSGNYSEAIRKFNDYLNSDDKKKGENIALAMQGIEECRSALIITKDTLRIRIENIGSDINSSSDDYSELFADNGTTLYFASRRELPKSRNAYQDKKFDENIFISHLVNGEWELATAAPKNLLSKYCEAPLHINRGGDTLFIYTGYENNGDIAFSVRKKGEWKSPVKVPFGINSDRSETSFVINPTGDEIYFVSDNRKDSFGGKDIYRISKIDGHKWTKPLNAGPVINSDLDEESVRFSDSGDTLWFSSKGHNSIGGYDIFFSVKNQAGEWGSVKNYGYPVNTVWDEIFYNPSPVDDSAFFFVSNRSGGFGGLDIYHGRILPPEKAVIEQPASPARDTLILRDTVIVEKEVFPIPISKPELLFYLTGRVKDSETGAPILAKVDVIDLNTGSVIATTASSDLDGSYRIKLPEKKSYIVEMRATGFLPDMNQVIIPDGYEKEIFNFDVGLIRVSVGKKVVLNNILFETGKSVLSASSNAELDRLYTILMENPQMKIEISGHTDNTGSESLNFRLSEARANAVVEYLVQKGISRLRMEFKGFGSMQPIADNATAQGRAKNRRVEFKILEF